MSDPFPELYDSYARCVHLALTSNRRTWTAIALEYESLLDAEWDRMSRTMPPQQRLGCVRFPRHRLRFFLDAIGHQAAFPDTSCTREGAAFSLSVRP